MRSRRTARCRAASLAERLQARGLLTDGQALVHQLFLASFRGLIVRGPMLGAEQAFVLTRDWLGEPPSLRPGGSGAGASRSPSWRAGTWPATARPRPPTSRSGPGCPCATSTAGPRGGGRSVRTRGDGLLELDAPSRRAPQSRRARLLPAFDPYLLGWKDRAYAVPEQHMSDVRMGGMIRAVATVAGTAVGTWATTGAGRGRTVEIDWWHDVSPTARAALERESADVLRFEAPAAGCPAGAGGYQAPPPPPPKPPPLKPPPLELCSTRTGAAAVAA